jgi:hypothetical protein
MSVLADVILIGHDKVGSYALSSQKKELFSTALGAFLDMIQAVITKQGIARLCKLNGFPPELYPAMQHEDVETPDLESLGKYIESLSRAGMSVFPSPDGSIEKYMLEAGSLPVPADSADTM